MNCVRVYKQALEDAVTYMENEPELEPASSLKQAGADNGIKGNGC
jgi:hypothetical protein